MLQGLRSVVAGGLALFAGLGANAQPSATAQAKQAFERPKFIPFPAEAPYSLPMATLGKMLFFDPRLSGPQNMSCVACHNPSFGWEVPVERAVGASNQPLPRHAQTIVNAAWIEPFFWDGRAPSLEEQAAGPLTAEAEMNNSFAVITERLAEIDEYRHWFDRLFPGQGITRETVLTAIATYERTIVSSVAPFDRWVEGDDQAISASAKRGFDLFVGRANCVACHMGWNFTDNAFHDIGLASDDIGRGGVTPDDPQAGFAFKTPGLRDIDQRAPYMHDGSLPDLEVVIFHYASGGIPRPTLAAEVQPFEVDDQDVADLVAFLRTLSGAGSDVPTPTLPAH